MHDDETTTDATSVAGTAASDDPGVGLGTVRALRALADRLEDVHVASARTKGWSWQAIADVLQVSRQAVHQKHSQREAASAAGKDGNDV
ncbi:helix-turn-helix domain-containing protein [Gordonia sp. HY442]|uniref:helix-turn-helix domain-containing protein n=1 Tax=Gordonia zhenghanii TaxID=2911516 RepID=UPI001F3886A5|nr:helix-turn-helix domain-containing protein [Gordonia zhenghanii]MCF8604755.1 helix-turn-helix domain-containing protein [Gordonia zhenghanii]